MTSPQIPSWQVIRLLGPELWLAVGMCAVILIALVNRTDKRLPTAAALAAAGLAGLAAVLSIAEAGRSVLAGMLVVDPFSQFFKLLLAGCLILVIGQWALMEKERLHPYDVPDFLCLVLAAAFGMAMMASASHLLTIFLAIEAASYPSYVLAGFQKRERPGAEAALKYAVLGAACTGVMVYGMSLIYGTAGTLDLSEVARAAVWEMSPLLAVGLLAMLAGLAFKLAAVPLHYWCPDAFEGASTSVATFLSIASKGAAVVLLVRVVACFGQAWPQVGEGPPVGLVTAVAMLGAVTATWGNLVAMHQNHIRRLLAYSSIAHAGYMIMAAALAALSGSPALLQALSGAILFYLTVYLFMNLGAFTVAALVERQEGSLKLEDWAGLIGRQPVATVLMSVFLLSLFGLPALGGFAAKIYLAVEMLQIAGQGGYVLVVILLVNTLLSLYVYVRPIYYMVLVPGSRVQPAQPTGMLGTVLLGIALAGVLGTGLVPSPIRRMTDDHAVLVFPRSPVQTAVQGPQAEESHVIRPTDIRRQDCSARANCAL